MPRIVRGSYDGATLPVQYGGTGQTDLAGIRNSLALLQASELGAANGYATLDANRKIPLSQLGNMFMKIAIRGPRSLISGDTGTYTIENYDDTVDYVITNYNGTLSRVKDVITYSPSQAGSQGFTINGMQVPINVGVPGPIGVWGNAEEVPCGASIGISSSPGTYRTNVFATAGGKVQSCSITQPADLPAGCSVAAEVNFSEGATGVYVELQGSIPTTEYTGTCQLTVTTVAQAGNPNPSYPLGTQTQTISVKARKYLFQYQGVSTVSLNTGQSASFYASNRADPSGLSTTKAAWGTYSVLSGSLPPGLSIDTGYGYVGCHISGSPSSAGNYSAVIRHSAPAGWETQPQKVQDITVNINVVTPIPDNENLVSEIDTYRLASGTIVTRVLKNNTGSIPNPYEWKLIDGNNTPVPDFTYAGVAPGDGHGYIDVTQKPGSGVIPRTYTNLNFTYNNNSGAFFASTGVFLTIRQAVFSMASTGTQTRQMGQSMSNYIPVATRTGQINAGGVQLLSGSVPPGMSLGSGFIPITGEQGVLLTGTPTAGGTYTFTYRVTGTSPQGYHFNTATVDVTSTVVLNSPFNVSSPSFTYSSSSAQSATVATSLAGTLKSGASSSLPSGCTLTANAGDTTARINIPAGFATGTYAYTISLPFNSGNGYTADTFVFSGQFTVVGPPDFHNESPSLVYGTTSSAVAVTSNYWPITGVLSVNNAPTGCSVYASGGVLMVSITPSTPVGNYSISCQIQTSDGSGNSGSGWYTFGLSVHT